MKFQLISVERANNEYFHNGVVIKVLMLNPIEVHNWVMQESEYLDKELYITNILYDYLNEKYGEVF